MTNEAGRTQHVVEKNCGASGRRGGRANHTHACRAGGEAVETLTTATTKSTPTHGYEPTREAAMAVTVDGREEGR